MCARARCSLCREEAAKKADVPEEKWKDIDKFEPKYNIQPGSNALVVVKDGEGKKSIQAMQWGLVPSWTKGAEAKPDFFRMFNARSETVHEKSVFGRLLSGKRCIVLLNGFYEWAQEHKIKQPYYIHYADERIMAMAGLFDNWKDAEGNWLTTFTILTTDSSKRLEWLHNRMPVLLPNEEMEAAWLADEVPDAKQFMKVCEPYNCEDLQWHLVTPAMSKPSFQGPECCKPLKRQSIATFFKPKAAPEGGITRELVKEEKSTPAASLKSEKAPSVQKSSSANEVKQVKQEEQDDEQQPSQSSVRQEPTEAYEQKEKGTKRWASGPPQKSPPKKAARKGGGGQSTSPAAGVKEGPMDSFLIKNSK